MPLYSFKASDKTNQVKSGTISAPTAEEIAQILKKRGLNPISIKEAKGSAKVTGTLPAIEKIAFCRYISTLIKSGMSLTEGVPVLKEESKDPLMRQILDDIIYHLEQGQPLSTALKLYPNVFDKFFITLVKAGEISGNLGESFSFLEKSIRAEYSLSQKIKSALMYPTVIIIAMIAIGSLMFFFILPQIGKVFLAMTIPLPTVTKALFTFSVAAAAIRIPIMISFLVGMILLFIFLKKPAGKKITLKILSPMPVINKLLEQIDVARFCRIFSTLVSSAVPIIDALDISLNSLSHPKFDKLDEKIIKEVKQGKSLASSFTTHKVFPPLLIQMISAGEKSGTLDVALADLASFYEEEVSEAVKKSTQLLEPILMLAVGIGVGAMILAIIAPLYSVIGSLQSVQ
jgi:type IV pilus assembly protein PilC